LTQNNSSSPNARFETSKSTNSFSISLMRTTMVCWPHSIWERISKIVDTNQEEHLYTSPCQCSTPMTEVKLVLSNSLSSWHKSHTRTTRLKILREFLSTLMKKTKGS
jgi:hypothetical protein